MEVVGARWPAERERVERLRGVGTPRLLVVDRDGPPPEATADCLEDWIRAPASDADAATRLEALRLRADRHAARPTLDDDGLCRFRDSWVSLSPVERALAAALVERYGAVVSREVLGARAWPDAMPTRNALDVHMLRLRRRLAGLGLEVRTIRARGYLLQEAASDGATEVRAAR